MACKALFHQIILNACTSHYTGVGISYLVVIGDLMPDVMSQFLDGGVLCQRSFWVVTMTVFVLIPLASLRYVSLQYDNLPHQV